MKIVIDQHFSGRYEFSEGDDADYSFYGYERSNLFTGDRFDLYDKSKMKELEITCQRPFLPWKPGKITFRIYFVKDQTSIDVICKSYKNGHWGLTADGNSYDVYLHGHRKKSLYKNDVQVAKYVSTNGLYFIISNSDENVLLLIGLFAVFSTGETRPDSDLVLDLYDDARDENKTWIPTR